ncbi:MAG: SWIM zinc finger family protein [Gemmataceae bacterium]
MRRRRNRPERKEFFPPRSKPLEAQGGIKAQSRQGDFGQSWWAKRWQAVLEGFRIGGRLARGRTYARTGQVLSIDIHAGEVTARVQGSRPQPYDVAIAVAQLSDAEWGQVLEVLSRQALFVAKLLAGEMPQDIERVFTQANLSLFPRKRGDLRTQCSCPDEANPCKHIAAVYYLLGEEFDRDPFLLFRLRGLEREDLLAKLGNQARAMVEAPRETAPAVEPLPLEPSAFWALAPLPEDFYGEVETPPLSAGLVRRLGKFPFWRGERTMVDALEPVYLQTSKVGLNLFLGEKADDARRE